MAGIGWKMLLVLSVITSVATSDAFYDDFEDAYIGDWTPRCAWGLWEESGGYATGSTGGTPSALVNPTGIIVEDCNITTLCIGTHAFGVIARLNSSDTGVIAYVSPDHDLARIRLVSCGQLSDDLVTITAPFPDGEQYLLDFTCIGSNLSFDISIPATGDSWSFSTMTSHTDPGECGLIMGDEVEAIWDWFSFNIVTGIEQESATVYPQLQIRPNPFDDMVEICTPMSSVGAEPVEVFDLSGRVVARLLPERAGDGSAVYRWDGMTADGVESSPGVYLIKWVAPGESSGLLPLIRIE